MSQRKANDRTKRYAPRSRNGCIPCRRRHVRCDEARPVCTKCLVRNISCEYLAAEVPRSDTKISAAGLPGVQKPWQALDVWQLPNSAVDPFNTLPIKMVLKSRELLHYFAHVRQDRVATTPPDESLVLATQDPDAFRSILLLAAVHYSWKTGSLRYFESTYLLHKIECIRIIKQYLPDPTQRDATMCAKMVATLCIAESSLGNLEAAEAHLDGLMALLEMKHSTRGQHGDRTADDMLLERYTLVCIGEIMLLKKVLFGTLHSRLQTKSNSICSNLESMAKKTEPKTFSIATSWVDRGTGNLDDRLQALSLIPFFVVPKKRVSTYESVLDAKDSIAGLRIITAMQNGKKSDISLPTTEMPEHRVVSRVWSVQGGNGPMIHVPALGLLRDDNSDTKLWTSWAGLTVSAGFYLHGPLSIWDPRQAVEGRTFLWLIRMSQGDLENSENDMITGATDRALWFWKLFTMAFALSHQSALAGAAGTLDRSITGGGCTYEALHLWSRNRIRLWSMVEGVTEWDEARNVLTTVVWPESFPGDILAQAIWEEAVNSGN